MSCHIVRPLSEKPGISVPATPVEITLYNSSSVLAWRNRTVWLPAARRHQASADLSQSRSATELVLMAAALTLAAALAVTG